MTETAVTETKCAYVPTLYVCSSSAEADVVPAGQWETFNAALRAIAVQGTGPVLQIAPTETPRIGCGRRFATKWQLQIHQLCFDGSTPDRQCQPAKSRGRR